MEKVKPKKHLGQHFLIDLSIAARIAEAVDGHMGVTQVLEIGSGMGVLTDFLVKGNLEVHLIEIDRESIAYLHQKYADLQDRILEGDFLKFDLTVPTQIESGAVNILTYTTDYAGIIRYGNASSTSTGTAPDLGAWELDGTVAVAMSYTSSTTVQLTGNAYVNQNNQAIIRVKIVTTGAINALTVSKLILNANGTTDIANINATTAKVYYTTNTTFIIMDFNNFDWGWMGQTEEGPFHKELITQETFVERIYEKFFEVEEGDIVLDIGASVGPFTYSILHKNPKQVFCFEPSEREFKTLVKNLRGHQVIPIPKGISNVNSIVKSDMLFGGEDEMETLTFERFLNLYNVDKIDFIKTDCEGGEYDIFTQDNLEFLKHNVKKVVGEWHLRTPQLKEKFRNFRDNILPNFKHYRVFSLDGTDIQWDLWNEHFIEYYTEVIIHIDNR